MAAKFTKMQTSILQTHYKKGMVGTADVFMPHIVSAAEKAGLSCKQVKVKYKHAFASISFCHRYYI